VTPAQCPGKYITYIRSLTEATFRYAAPATVASLGLIRFATAKIYRSTAAEYRCFKVTSKDCCVKTKS